jgi:hypothetical protein
MPSRFTKQKKRAEIRSPNQTNLMNETSQLQLKILEQSVIKNASRTLTYMIKTPKTKHISLTRIESQFKPSKLQPRERKKINNIRILNSGYKSTIKPSKSEE